MGLFDRLFKRNTPPESARKLGRNARCWCDSGRKYKQCHLESDRQYFAATRPQPCTSSG